MATESLGAVSVVGLDGTGGPSPVVVCVCVLAATIVLQGIFWYLSTYVVKFDMYSNFGGLSIFIFLAFTSSTAGNMTESIHKVLVIGYVILWATRMLAFLNLRMERWGGHDRRLENIRSQPNGEAMFWIGQALWAFVTSLPIVLLASSSYSGSSVAEVAFSFIDVVIGVIYFIALFTQAFADLVKLGCYDGSRWLQMAIWKYSRHPNYFAEMVIWWSIFAASARVLPSHLVIPAALSPIFVTVLLLFVTGVPILERNADRKFGEIEEYLEYKRSTSLLIPLPNKIYCLIPRWIQKTVLLDFEMYNHINGRQEVLGERRRSAEARTSESVDDG